MRPAYYAGSPLQLDFGEVGQGKSFVLVTVSPGRPAQIEHVPYEGGRELADVRATLPELERGAAASAAGCWVRVTVPLVEKDPDLNRKVRALVPDVLVVHPEQEERPSAAPIELVDRGAPQERYAAFHLQEHRAAPAAPVLEAFAELYGQAAQGEG